MDIGALIRSKRLELGLTLEELAGEQMTPATLSNIERGKTVRIKPETKHYLMLRLGLSEDELDEKMYNVTYHEQRIQLYLLRKTSDPTQLLEAFERYTEFQFPTRLTLAQKLIPAGHTDKVDEILQSLRKLPVKDIEQIRLKTTEGKNRLSQSKPAAALTAFNEADALMTTDLIEAYTEDHLRIKYNQLLAEKKLKVLDNYLTKLDYLIELAEKAESSKFLSKLLVLKSRFFTDSKDYEKAVELLYRCLDLGSYRVPPHTSATCWLNLGFNFLLMERLDLARQCYETSKSLFENIGSKIGVLRTKMNLMKLSEASNEQKVEAYEALMYEAMTYRAAQEAHTTFRFMQPLLSDVALCYKYYEEVCKFLEDMQAEHTLGSFYFDYATFLEKHGQMTDALYYFKASMRIFEHSRHFKGDNYIYDDYTENQEN
ncbi:hypothetical protein B0H94_11330 [Salsuginibacillus halophilus]|uniref:HTH cro/C1-type domain-containing protein n=1 Tax=Salsuginibacillus halophilus TaxID=517424 RepID=A0A2P8H961_9BACI|nr:helix-turn-helix domain-containing protein [Salsuginibacillus halophilus]PSL42744.1 hypothetical protein B0H94_11330 [Salsuginibacillus halophilus]